MENYRIGIIGGTTRKAEITKFFKRNGVKKYKIIEYKSYKELKEALERWNIDMIYSSSLRKLDNEKIIFYVSSTSFYFAMNKKNLQTNMLIEEAINNIKIERPNFDRDLLRKYFGRIIKDKNTLSSEEKKYIKSLKEIKVAVDPNLYPIEGYSKETKKYQGVFIDILEEVSKNTGIKFKYLSLSSYSEIKKANEENRFDIFSTQNSNVYIAESNKIKLSTKNMSMPISLIANNRILDYKNTNNVVALVVGYGLSEEIIEKFGYKKIRYYDSIEKCIESVNRGVSDVTFLASYSSDYYMGKFKYKNILACILPDINYHIALGFSKNSDLLLRKIINDELDNMSDLNFGKLIRKNVLEFGYEKNLAYYLNRYPQVIITILLGIFVWIVALILHIYILNERAKAQIVINKKKMDLVLSYSNTVIFDYNVKTKKITQINNDNNYNFPFEIEDSLAALKNTKNISKKDVEMILEMFGEIIENNENEVVSIFKMKTVIGERWFKLRLVKVTDSFDKIIGIVGLLNDITSTKEKEEYLNRKAEQDGLTLLLNKKSFEDKVKNYLKEVDRKDIKTIGTIVTIDIDNFKEVNDKFGHPTGNKILKDVATILKENFRYSDFIGRMGGDEFMIFMKEAYSYDIVEEKCRMLKNLLVINLEDSSNFKVTCSIGALITKSDDYSYEELYEKVDKMMYSSKDKGENTYTIEYSENLND